MRHLAISAIREFISRGVDPDLRRVPMPVQMNNNPIAERPRVRAASVNLANSVHDGVLEPEVGEHRVVDAWILDRRRNAQVSAAWNDRFPWNLPCTALELIWMIARKGIE